MDGDGLRPAREISEMLLELTADSLLSGDFDAFACHFDLPHLISTTEGKTVVQTREEMRVMFERVAAEYARLQINNLIRICEVAEYRSPTHIEATHTSHMMSGDTRVLGPFPSFSILKCIDGQWKVSSSQYAFDKSTSLGEAIFTTPDTPSE